MKFFIYSALSLIFVFSSNLLKAQGTYTGCFTYYDNAVHTVSFFGTYANMTGRIGLSSSYCYWTPSVTSTPCEVCPASVVNATGRCQVSQTNTTLVSTVPGYYGSFSMVYCPLDKDLIGLLLLGAISGFFLIRQTKFIELV